MAVELSEDQKSKLRDTFNYFDKDSSGRIDRKELRETLKKLGDFCEMDIIQILTNADDDASGDLDFNEFCAKVAPKFFNLKKLNPADVEKAFEKYDTSKDGFIDSEEVVKLAEDLGFKNVTPEQAKTLVDMVDEEPKDGKINIEEFKRLVIVNQ